MVKKSNKGFTFVELLAVIVIIGILLGVSVFAVTRYINSAKKEQVSSQEKTLVIAAQNYLQENRGLLPKSIGETTTISVGVLKNNNYITETLKNTKKESCMENSYVEVSKDSSTKYTYKAHLYCGSDEGTKTIGKTIPTIDIKFVNANGVEMTAADADAVAEARFIIKYNGGKRNNEDIAIEGYSYSILIKVGNSYSEAYSSGTLDANHETNLFVEKYLKDYIDITNATTVLIKATVRNTEGGVNDKLISLGGEVKEFTYSDTKPPKCEKIIGEAQPNEWINTNSANKERKITVECNDANGSGCIRSTFTKTWTTNDSYIRDVVPIKDNAGNITNCDVLVNIDNGYPIISMKAYARGKKEGTITGGNVLTGTLTTENSPNGTAIIGSNDYANLVNGYISNLYYADGIIYKVNISDNLKLKSWKWEVNKPGIQDIGDANYEVVGYNEEDNIGEANENTCNGESCSFDITFIENGFRKGVLTVYDEAGNVSTFTIYANISRQKPKRPIIVNSSTGGSSGDWTNSNVYLLLSSNNHTLPLADYYYSYNEDAENIGTNDNQDWVRLSGTTEAGTFKTDSWVSEINKTVYVMVCDIAKNCSDSSNTKIMIDKSAPTGLKLTGYKRNNSTYITDPDDVAGLQTINSDVWHDGYVVIIPSGAKDNGGSGGVYYVVTVTGASTNTIDSVQDYRNVNAEGTSNVSFRACDKVDNCSNAVNFITKIDRSGPTIPLIVNSTGGNWTKSNITLTIESYDSGVGISKYYYSYTSGENASWTEILDGANKNSFSKTYSDDINKTLYIKACDKLGNCSEINNTIVRIDKTAPSVPEIDNPTNGEWTKNNFSLTLTSSDGTGSGLEDYQYTYNSNATEVGNDSATQWKSNGLTATESYTTTEFSVERNQKVYWRVCDAVGNCSGKSSTFIKIDKTKPTCGDITTSPDNVTQGLSGKIVCEDSNSGCVSDTYNFGPLIETTDVVIADTAGNTKNCPVSVTSTDCSIYSAWEFFSLYKENNNNCPSDVGDWDYESENCLTSDYDGVCAERCAAKCNGTTTCKHVCCVMRGKNPRTCYSHE